MMIEYKRWFFLFSDTSIDKEQNSKLVKLLKLLKDHKDSVNFLNPVNYIELNIPDYIEVIKKPMDLGTVE